MCVMLMTLRRIRADDAVQEGSSLCIGVIGGNGELFGERQ